MKIRDTETAFTSDNEHGQSVKVYSIEGSAKIVLQSGDGFEAGMWINGKQASKLIKILKGLK